MKQERSSNRIVSILRTNQNEGDIVHRSEEGIVHHSRPNTTGKIQFLKTRGVLEKQEIEDLGRVYKDVKAQLRIKTPSDVVRYQENSIDDENQPLSLSVMTPAKIKEMYFKRRGERKIVKGRFNLKQDGYPVPQSTRILNSKIINFVKTKNRLSYDAGQTNFWSQIDKYGDETNLAKAGNFVCVSESDNLDDSFQRTNIVSLETGLPIKPYIQLNSFKSKIEKREQLFESNRQPRKSKIIRSRSKSYNIQGIKLTSNPSNIVQSLQEHFSLAKDESQHNTTTINHDIQRQYNIVEKYNNLRIRVENNESSLMSCCEDFLITKKKKNSQFMNLIGTINRDRPLTQQIRLQMYSSRQSNGLKLNQLRRSAERSRESILKNNFTQFQWYEELTDQISRVRDDNENLAVCEYIFDTLKNLLEDGKHITQRHIYSILNNLDDNPDLLINNIGMFLIKRITEKFQIPIKQLNSKKVQNFIRILLQEKKVDEL